MTLDQLRIFVAVAERSHVTEAARALNLTQSATSSALAALENRHGIRLFDRVGRGIVLTEAGRLFLPHARAVLARASEATGALDDLTGLRRGHLSLIASQTVANHWLPKRMRRFRREHAGVTLALSIANSAQVQEAVLEGAAHLGLVEDEVHDPRLRSERVADDHLVLVAAPEHELTGKSADTEALARATWVMREQGSGTRAILEAVLRARGIDLAALAIDLELPSNEALRSAVAAGGVIGVLPLAAAEASLKAGTLGIIDAELPSRSFHAVWSREREPSRAADAFRRMLGAGADECPD